MTSTQLHDRPPRARLAEVATTVPGPTWHALLEADPDAMPTQSPQWLAAVCASGEWEDASRLYRAADGRTALLPLVARTRRPGWAQALASPPVAWGYGGLLCDGAVTADLVAAVLDDVTATHPLRLHVRPNPLHAEAWREALRGRAGLSVRDGCAHVLDLTGGFETVWSQRFKQMTRTQVRRAERMGVEVETDTGGRLVGVLDQLLASSTDRWAEHQHEPRALARWRRTRRDPVSKLRTIADALGEACRVSVAWYDGRPAAAILVLRGRNAHYTRGAMDEELAGRTQANRLLHKVAIEEACAAGCSAYHMGETGGSEGLAQFKSRFGAVAHPYPELWLERLPLHGADQGLRGAVKRVIGFRDV
jgi:hypothetical protein